MAHQARDPFRFEEIGVRFEQANQLPVTLDNVQSKIEVRHRVADAKVFDLKSRQLQRRQLFILQHEHGLEQRVVPERPLGLQFSYQLLKWHVLIRITAERSLSY